MAITVTFAKDSGYNLPLRVGRLFIARGTWTLAGTYATGGYTYAVADFGIPSGASILEIDLDNLFRNGTNAVIPSWDTTNKKIMFFQSTTGAPNALIEVANTTNLASYAGRVRVTYLE